MTTDIQVGFYCTAESIDNKTTTNYYAWTEWFPAPQQSYKDFELQAGDVLTINIVADSKTSGSTLLHNHRTGKKAQTSYTNQTTPLCLNTAEWVIESELAFTSFGLDGERTAGYQPFVFEHAAYSTKGKHDWIMKLDAILTNICKDGKKHLAKAEDMFNMVQNGTEVAEAVYVKNGLFKVKDVTPADFAKGE